MRLLVASAALACAIGCAQQSDVFPDDTTTLELHVAGGLAPAPGPGSTCTPEDTTYDYVLATRALSWTAYQSGSDGVFTEQPGQTTLGDDAAHQLHDRSPHSRCRPTRAGPISRPRCTSPRPTVRRTIRRPNASSGSPASRTRSGRPRSSARSAMKRRAAPPRDRRVRARRARARRIGAPDLGQVRRPRTSRGRTRRRAGSASRPPTSPSRSAWRPMRARPPRGRGIAGRRARTSRTGSRSTGCRATPPVATVAGEFVSVTWTARARRPRRFASTSPRSSRSTQRHVAIVRLSAPGAKPVDAIVRAGTAVLELRAGQRRRRCSRGSRTAWTTSRRAAITSRSCSRCCSS